MVGEFWLERTGYDENCKLLSMREVLFARVVNLSKDARKRDIKKLSVLLEKYLFTSKKKQRSMI